MAHKGDFPECDRCTSFQCRTCGLDSGVFKEEGSVSSGNSLIKTNIICIILLILSEFIDKKPIEPIYLFTQLSHHENNANPLKILASRRI